MLNIKCIGFSVTGYGDPPYPLLLQEKLKSKIGVDVSVDYASVGGLSIDALPYLAGKFLTNARVNILVIEIATSWISLHLDDEGYAENLICQSLASFSKFADNIIFLNLYRKDISDFDMVVRAINNIASRLKNISVIDLKSINRARLQQTGIDGTNDGVHPLPETINEISDVLALYIYERYSDFRLSNTNYIGGSDGCQIELPDVNGAELDIFDNRHGLRLEIYKMSAGLDYICSFSRLVECAGIFFIWGPDTTSINLSIGDRNFNIAMYDEMSFYRRVGFYRFESAFVERVAIQVHSKKPLVELQRDPWEVVSTSNCYLAGFAIN